MNVETRKTAAGTEYWDTEEKRVRFVPAGQEPGFEVTENPKSMIGGVDLTTGKDMSIVEGKVVDSPLGVSDEENNYDLSSMKIKELKELADDNKLEIPSDVTKRDDIAQYIFDNWNSDQSE